MEHHANLVPWQELCDKTGAVLRWIGLTDDGRLDLDDLDAVITERTRVVSFVHQSQHPRHHQPGGPDRGPRPRGRGARRARRLPVGAAHAGRRAGPSTSTSWPSPGTRCSDPPGVGCLWGRTDLLEAMPPFLTGGSMIARSSMERSTFAAPPQRFEAGLAERRPGRGAGRGRAVPRADRACRRSPAHEHALTDVRPRGARRAPRRADHRADHGRRVAGRRVSFVGRRPPPPRRRPGARRRGRRRAGRPPLRVADVPALRRRRRRPGPASTLYNHPTTSTPSSSGSGGRSSSSGWRDGARCTRRSSSTTTATRAGRGLREPFEAEVHHVNPTCGDEITLRVHLEGGASRHRRRHLVRRPGVLDLAGQRQRDVRAAASAAPSPRRWPRTRPSCSSCSRRRGDASSPTRTCSGTRSRSRAWRSTRHGSSARCWPGWPGRTPSPRPWPHGGSR